MLAGWAGWLAGWMACNSAVAVTIVEAVSDALVGAFVVHSFSALEYTI